MKPNIIFLAEFLIIGTITTASAQTDINQMWKNQSDTSHVSFLKREFLEIKTDEVFELYSKQPNFGIYIFIRRLLPITTIIRVSY